MSKFMMLSGSCRRGSLNTKLLKVIATQIRKHGSEATLIDLADYLMPIYNGDVEEKDGHPEHAKTLHAMLADNDGLVVTSPEYNGLPSPLLKNTIDWISRVDVNVFGGKVAAIAAASPGGLGGLRGLPHLRTLLTNINVTVIPQQVAVGGAMDAFDEDGNLHAPHLERVSQMVEALLHSAR